MHPGGCAAPAGAARPPCEDRSREKNRSQVQRGRGPPLSFMFSDWNPLHAVQTWFLIWKIPGRQRPENVLQSVPGPGCGCQARSHTTGFLSPGEARGQALTFWGRNEIAGPESHVPCGGGRCWKLAEPVLFQVFGMLIHAGLS